MTAVTTLDRLRGKTAKQQAVILALRAGGWKVVVIPFPGAVTLGHPDNEVEIPTPDYAREEYAPGRAYYPFPTYHVYRQLTILYDVQPGAEIAAAEGQPITIKIRSMFARQDTPPWITSREYTIGLGKALDYIREPHPATAAAQEEAQQS
jgi:hypothetical protein